MNTPFKNDDWFANDETVTPELLRAAHAVCGVDYPEEGWRQGCRVNVVYWDGRLEVASMLNFNKPEQQHTITEWLFKGAPDWAFDLRLTRSGNYLYTDIINRHMLVGGGHLGTYTPDSAIPVGKIIAIRKAATETADDWYDYEEQTGTPPVGVECEYTSRFITSDIKKWFGCKIRAYDGGMVWLTTTAKKHDHVKVARDYQFRPLDHDKHKNRDEWVDQTAAKVITSEIQSKKGIIIAIYDAWKSGEIEGLK